MTGVQTCALSDLGSSILEGSFDVGRSLIGGGGGGRQYGGRL